DPARRPDHGDAGCRVDVSDARLAWRRVGNVHGAYRRVTLLERRLGSTHDPGMLASASASTSRTRALRSLQQDARLLVGQRKTGKRVDRDGGRPVGDVADEGEGGPPLDGDDPEA